MAVIFFVAISLILFRYALTQGPPPSDLGAALEQAKREGITYALAHRMHVGPLDDSYVIWDIVPAGEGKAFHRGAYQETIRIVGPLPEDVAWGSGKSAGSMKVLGRLQRDGQGVGLQILQAL